MQWLQYLNQSNIDNLNNVRREASRHFRNKKKTYLNAKFEGLENNSKIKNNWGLFRSIDDFKKGYQPRTIIVMEEKCDLIANSFSIVAGWKNCFSQLLIVHGVSNVMQTEIYTSEPLVPLRLRWLLKS